MIGVLTHHWAKTDKVDEARKLLDRNGEAQSNDAPDARPSVTANVSGAARPIKRDGAETAAESPEDDFAELVEPEDPPQPCHKCHGWSRQRIGFGNKTEPCDRCGGTGTCNGLEKKWDTFVPCESCRQLGRI